MSYHPSTKQIINLLKENNCWFETFEHKAVRTSEEAAKLRPGYSLKQGAKAIIIRVKQSKGKKFFVMVVLPGNLRFNNEKIKTLFSAKDIRFANPEEVAKLTNGVEGGGVPPFGNLFNLPIYVDSKLFKQEKIIFNAGDRRFSVGMKSQDYKKIVKPNIVNLV